MPDLNWLDMTMLGIVGLSLLLGLWRGLVYELLSVLGWFVAYMAAPWLAPTLRPWLPLQTWGEGPVHALALVCAFLLVLLTWSLSAKLIRGLIQASPLSWFDRLGGAGFGLLRAGLILMLVAVLVAMTPLVESQVWEDSLLVPWLQGALALLRPIFPAEVVKFIPA